MGQVVQVAQVVIGDRFGKLVVIELVAERKHHVTVQCDCGITKEVRRYDVANGSIKSCGCYRRAVTGALAGKRRKRKTK
jgi:hypothetical protein